MILSFSIWWSETRSVSSQCQKRISSWIAKFLANENIKEFQWFTGKLFNNNNNNFQLNNDHPSLLWTLPILISLHWHSQHKIHWTESTINYIITFFDFSCSKRAAGAAVQNWRLVVLRVRSIQSRPGMSLTLSTGFSAKWGALFPSGFFEPFESPWAVFLRMLLSSGTLGTWSLFLMLPRVALSTSSCSFS